MKIRKELWFGFSLMAIIIVAVLIFTPWASLFDGHLSHEDLGALGLLMHWFIKRGFVQVDPDWLPEARKRKYNWDRRSQVFVKKLA